jgi:iron-sulfur cluster assembly protein
MNHVSSKISIHLTKSAEMHLAGLRKKSSGPGAWLLSLQRTGCSGFSYDFKWMEHMADDSVKVFENNDFAVFLDAQYASWLDGLQIDLETDTIGLKKLVYHNPREAGRCGCGQSFSVKE